MPPLIVVTGSTGTVGSELVRLLSAAGAPTRAVYRRAGRAPELSGVSFFKADLADPEQLEAALSGATLLFLLSGNDPGFAELQTAVIHAATRGGVGHVVKLSALGASDHSRSPIGRDHWLVEQTLLQSGLPWT